MTGQMFDWKAMEAARKAAARWVALGDAGVTVSVCYGPSGPMRQRIWTVQALGPNGDEFDRPYAARDAEHAVEIAEIEAKRRGWLSDRAFGRKPLD